MEATLMEIFGPWLPLLFGRGAANVGWRMMLFAATMYLLVLALSAAFQSMLSHPPGA